MTDSTRLILDLDKACRTCLVEKSSEELRSLLENNLGKILGEIANIQLDFHSSLPKFICTECVKSLDIALEFRNQVHEAESQLRNLIYSVDQTDHLTPLTVIYNSFAVLENSVVSAECRNGDNKEEKFEQFAKVLVIENTDSEQSCSQNKTRHDRKKVVENVFKDNTEVYAVTDDGDAIEYFVADDDSVNTTDKSKTLTINNSDILINGNISNVIKWANSENNSISLSNNFVEGNQSQNLQKQVLVAGDTLKVFAENTEINEKKESKNITKIDIENIKTEMLQKVEPGKKTVNFKCEVCAKKFRYDFGHKAHLLRHGIPMFCKICPSAFNDSRNYLAHTKSDHPDFKPFTCPDCDKSFSVMSSLRKHSVYHSVDRKPRKFPCDICKKRFSQHNFLVAHKRSHSGGNPYQCDTCNKNFSGAHSFRNHLKIHRGEKKHKCNVCDARFIHRFSLRGHQRTHSGEKPFECKVCNNRFSTSSYLKIHMRTHTLEKPYRCPSCSKTFVSRCALAAHEKSHSSEKKFQCDVCGWRSTRLADLQTHMRSHSGEKPYFCDQCDKCYKTSSNLAAHKKTHLGLKEHICHICNKAFGDPRTLKGHIRVHTGETPYQCHICGNRFKQSGQLSAHRKTHQD